MTKRDITLVAFGAVAAALGAVAALLAYGVFVSPSAEVPEVAEVEERLEKLEERTVAEVAEQLAETEEQIAALEADIEYLKTEVIAARMRERGMSVPPYLWVELQVCWEFGMTVSNRCLPSTLEFVYYCRTEPQCTAAFSAWMTKRDELRGLESTKFDLELQQAKLELDQKLKERER